MKKFIFIVLLGLYALSGFSQTSPCGTIPLPSDPAFESFYQQAIESRAASCNVIPVRLIS